MNNDLNPIVQNKFLSNINKFTSNKYFILFSAIFIIFVNILIYSNIYDNSTHFDDEFIFKNPDLHNPNNLDKLSSINKFRIVPFWTFAKNYVDSNGGKDLTVFYTTNIMIHIINSLLVFGIVFLIFRTPVIKKTNIAQSGALLAFFAGLMFAVHPLQTQGVTYIYQRLASIAATFYFGAIITYLAGRLINKNILLKLPFFALSLLFLLFGLFSKENVFTIFPMILIIELIFFNKNFKVSPVAVVVFFGLIAIGIFIFLQFQILSNIFAPLTNFNGEIITSQNYLLTQFKVLPIYFKLFLIPIGQNFDHDIRISNSFFDPDVLIGFAVIILIMSFAIFMYKHNRLVTFGIIWVFLTISVESSIIPIADVIFEHRVYLPMLGLVLALIGLLYEIFSLKSALLPVLFVVLLSISGINASLAHARNEIWNSEYSLWSDAASKSPNKARVFFKRGQANANERQLTSALNDFSKVIELRPEFLSAYTYRAAIYTSQEKYRLALDDQNMFFELSKDKTQAYLNRARTYTKLNQFGKAIADYTAYLKKNNLDTDIYLEKAAVYERINDAVNAIKTTREAVETDKNNPNAMYQLGRYYFMKHEFDSAIVWLTKAQNSPSIGNSAKAGIYHIMGNYYYFHKDYTKAIEQYNLSLSVSGRYMNALINLAITYRTINDYQKELEIIDRIIKLDGNNDVNWQMRGICHINLKKYQDAIYDFEQSLSINKSNSISRTKLMELKKSLN